MKTIADVLIWLTVQMGSALVAAAAGWLERHAGRMYWRTSRFRRQLMGRPLVQDHDHRIRAYATTDERVALAERFEGLAIEQNHKLTRALEAIEADATASDVVRAFARDALAGSIRHWQKPEKGPAK